MKAHELTRSKGLTDKANRKGRGNASKGNTSGKGHKGQKARSGYSRPPGFEGGQTPLVMKLPKARGFKRYFKLLKHVTPINLQRLQEDDRIIDKATVDKKLLNELGYIKDMAGLVKILGNGDITKALNFEEIEQFSASAKAKIEKAGGSVPQQTDKE
jgi:large subunit ribosomal protein L15